MGHLHRTVHTTVPLTKVPLGCYIISNRYRILKQVIPLEPENVEKVVLACCTLHNYLRSKTCSRLMYSPPGTFDEENRNTGIFSDGSWREQGPVTFRGITPQSYNSQRQMQETFETSFAIISLPMDKCPGNGE